MATIKTGWLLNNNGEKFAPKTLISQVSANDGTLLEIKLENDLSDFETQINKTIDTKITTEKSERETEIAVERARIDAFVALPEGSTTGDAALEDIKIKVDGTSADTAGNAVREQINTLDDKIDEEVGKLSSDIVEISDTFTKKKNLCVEVDEGYLYSCWGGVGTAVIKEANENMFTAKAILNGNEEYITCNTSISASDFSFFADENGGMIAKLSDCLYTVHNSGSSYVYSVPPNAKIVYGSNYKMYLKDSGVVLVKGNEILPNNISIEILPYSESAYFIDGMKFFDGESLVEMRKSLKPLYVEKDGSGDFTRLIDAIAEAEKTMFRKVYVGAGEWDIIEELGTEYIESVDMYKRGVYLKNGIHLIFSSRAIVKCNYVGTNQSTIEWLSAFNAGKYGFTLENCKIETSNCRYSVHDERDSDTDQYKNVYKNCFMTHTKMGGNEQCIGGGLGLDGHIIIDGCKFVCVDGNENSSAVSYHNSGDGYWEGTESKGAQSVVEIADSYFSGTIHALTFGNSTKDTEFLIHGNSVGSNIVVPLEPNPVIKVTVWNNEVRS